MKILSRKRDFSLEQETLFTKVEDVFNEMKNDDRIYVADKYIDRYGTMVISVAGGRNGSGNWSSYLSNLSNVMTELMNRNIDCWFINGQNDCLDDVFNMEFGIKEK